MSDWDRAREILRELQVEDETPFEARGIIETGMKHDEAIRTLARIVEQLIPQPKTILSVPDPGDHAR